MTEHETQIIDLAEVERANRLWMDTMHDIAAAGGDFQVFLQVSLLIGLRVYAGIEGEGAMRTLSDDAMRINPSPLGRC
tara:strand:- start:901 stop:1134 length:234 start_codon:yes stop_codon:yes gene_type:complete